jgi:hypothetical protein
VVVLVVVLGLLAGGLPALVTGSPGSGPGHGVAAQAPGSQGSVHSLPWWDPRGWLGGGGGAPAAHAIADYKPAAARPPGRVAGQGPHKPAHRVRELTSKRTEYSSTYQMPDGTRQQVISAGPVNYQTSPGQWAPISTKVRRSPKAGFAFQDVANTFGSYFGSSAAAGAVPAAGARLGEHRPGRRAGPGPEGQRVNRHSGIRRSDALDTHGHRSIGADLCRR